MKRSCCLLTLLFLVCYCFGAAGRAEATSRVIIDADTANEIDDLYAIVLAIVAPEFKVEGVTSAHFTRSTESNDTVRRSQEINEQLLGAMGLRDSIPHPIGANRSMPDATTAVDSPAARLIIETGLCRRPGRQTDGLCPGGLHEPGVSPGA